MNRDDINDDDLDDQGDTYELPKEPSLQSRPPDVVSRRRIEELKELRRIREELEDDELIVDFN